MSKERWLLRAFKAVGLALTLGISMSACGTNTFTWKEEVLLRDGKKIIVDRSDIYDSNMGHEIGQGAPLAEHTTAFMIPGTSQEVIWKSNNRSPNPDDLDLLALDFADGVPFVATTPAGYFAYNKWNRPNPPYLFFKYANKKWQRISLEEFPETFKINLIVTGRKKDEPKILDAYKKFGFVPTQIVAEVNREPGMSEKYYTILRTPIDYGPPRQEHKGSKAPVSIAP